MQCTNPVLLQTKEILKKYPMGLRVPCGKCVMCRIQKRKEWSTRILHESSVHKDSVFITLTYNDSYVPENASLKKEHLQKFIKRLRSYLDYYDNGRKIRYFACGEYGDKTQRPHYHLLIFGLSLKDKNIINDNWTYGFIHYGMVEPDSIRYVAQYVDKKFSGDLAVEEYKNKNREPVFRISSLGIGREYADKMKDQIINHGITVNGIRQSIPRYYINRLGIDTEKLKAHSEQSECKLVDQLTGNNITIDDAYLYLSPDEVMLIDESEKNSNRQKEINYLAKKKLREPKI